MDGALACNEGRGCDADAGQANIIALPHRLGVQLPGST